MNWFREWILQIAGIIIIGALCDMILPQSETRKYVKMVVGLVMVFAVIRPAAGVSFDELTPQIPKNVRNQAVELKEQLDNVEQEEIIGLYCKKIEEKIRAELPPKLQDAKIEIWVEEEKNEYFGSIKSVSVEIKGAETGADTEKLKDVISEKFGVEKNSVTVRIN
ncbi:MAG: stage III sporulation protein AF [Clostridia bacterium]|nr:stage III sporulation protein AF [Clostridia bacterium]